MATASDKNRAGSVADRSAALATEADDRPLPVGTLLDNRFVVRSVLGRGGFGITYMAEHSGIGRRVALKEHFPEQFAVRQGRSVRATSSGAGLFKWGLDRFLEEARRLGRFKHPSIVDVTDVFEANGTAYMALAYEEGETLGAWLDRIARVPTQAEFDRLLEPILDALEYIHGHDILHRDIAPDNIILRRGGTPVLIDFGAARQAFAEKSQTLTGIVKHGFSPPEQYARSSAHHGAWSDIYALGATLYRAVTGAAPPDAPDRQIVDTLAPLDGLTGKNLRPSFLAAIMQSLELKPADRPQSITSWRPALLGSQVTQAGPRSAPPARSSDPSTPEPSPGQVRSHSRLPDPPDAADAEGASPAASIDANTSRRRTWSYMAIALVLTLAAAGGGYYYADVLSSEKAARDRIAEAQRQEQQRRDEAKRREQPPPPQARRPQVPPPPQAQRPQVPPPPPPPPQAQRPQVPPPAAPPGVASPQAGVVPDLNTQNRLTNETMAVFLASLADRTMTRFHQHVSQTWQRQITVTQLDQIFRDMISNVTVTGNPLAGRNPVYTIPASIDPQGRLKLTGHYDVPAPNNGPVSRASFVLGYILEQGQWKVISINFNIAPPNSNPPR